MVLCACFRAPSARFEEDAVSTVPQIVTRDLDVAKQVRSVLWAHTAAAVDVVSCCKHNLP